MSRDRDPYPPSPWFSVAVAADYSGYSTDTVYAALRAGDLAGSQRTAPRGTWRIHRDAVDRWLSGETPTSRLRTA